MHLIGAVLKNMQITAVSNFSIRSLRIQIKTTTFHFLIEASQIKTYGLNISLGVKSCKIRINSRYLRYFVEEETIEYVNQEF